MHPLLIILAALSLTGVAGEAPPSAFARGEPVVLPTTRCGDFFVAETMIEGQGPFAMVLDTGASVTGLTPAAARRLGGPDRLRALTIGTVEFTGQAPLKVVELDHLGDALGMPIDGILGHQLFRAALLTYDYPAGEVRVQLGALRDDEPGVAPMATGRRPFVGARIGEQTVPVLLDTGSSSGLTLGSFDRWRFVTPPPVVGGSIGVGGLEAVRAGRLADDVRFGSFTLTTPIVRSTTGDSLLGQSILRDFVVTVDQQRGRVRIVTPDGAAVTHRIVSASRFGPSWILWPDDRHLVIRHVVEGGAAARAGFRRGDRILAIDGTPWAEIGCARHEVRDDVPVSRRFLIQRDGERLELELTTALVVE